MKISPFGEVARILRMRYDLKLKHMAEHMQVSSSHLSSIEYGEKSLPEPRVALAIEFFEQHGASQDELRQLRRAAHQTQTEVQVGGLANHQRHLVAVFARQLAAGRTPDSRVMDFLDTTSEGGF